MHLVSRPVVATQPPAIPSSPSRYWLQWYRLRSGLGVPAYQLREAHQLGGHILGRLVRVGQQNPALYEDWVASQFTYPLRALLWRASRARRGYFLLNLIVVAGGFATSGIAVAAGAGHRNSTTAWIVFAIGLLVALSGGANQLFQPGSRANERTTALVQLRDEGWAFALAAGDYSGPDDVAAELFRERISAIHQRDASALELKLRDPTKQN